MEKVKTKIVISMGTGGVGKTTISSALGLKLYKNNNKVLLLTLDPSKSLMKLFSIKKSREVIKKNQSAILEVSCADAKTSFDQFLESVAKDQSKKLLDNKLFNLLRGKLSGAQDFTSLNQLYIEYKKNEYDYIVLDTPPLQNAKDFLTSPQKIKDLFNKSFIKWMSSEKEASTIKKLLSGGLSTAISALSKLTGKEFFDELKDFFSATYNIGDKITERAEAVKGLLATDKVRFVLVSGCSDVDLSHMDQILSDYKDMGIMLSVVYLNRVKAPKGLVDISEKTDLEKSFMGLFKNRGSRVESFKKRLSDHLKVATISERDKPVNTVDELIEMASSLKF